MKKWAHLHIDVDYCPSDPGIRNYTNFLLHAVLEFPEEEEEEDMHSN